MTVLWKSFGTLIARVWLFFRMYFKMILWIRTFGKFFKHWWQWYGFSFECILKCIFKLSLCEKTFRHWNKNIFFSSMCSYMTFQISILFKDLWALITWVWLFTCMYSQMGLQISTFQKSLLTIIARVRFFTCTHSQMVFKNHFLFKYLWVLITWLSM